jgi:hypothetical protein
MEELQERAGILDSKSRSEIEYQKFLALDGIGDHKSALELSAAIIQKSDKNSWEYASAYFDRAAIYLMLAQQNYPAIDADLLVKSKEALAKFSEIPKQPTEWRNYQSVCLDAIDAKDTSEFESVRAKFARLREEFDRLPATYKYKYLNTLDDIVAGTYRRDPGYPPPCRPLGAALKVAVAK